MAEDWADRIGEALEKKLEEVRENLKTLNSKRREINREFLKALWKIHQKFLEVGAHMVMDPPPVEWGIVTPQSDEIKLRDDIDFARFSSIMLIDRTQDLGALGDALVLRHTLEGETPIVEVLFRIYEAEKYYKYEGWKKVYSQFLVKKMPLAEADLGEIQEALTEPIVKWFEAHIRKDRSIFVDYVSSNFQQLEAKMVE